MITLVGASRRLLVAGASWVLAASFLTQPAPADDRPPASSGDQKPAAAAEQKPAVTGKNSSLQLSGAGWVTYRYKLADEPARESAGSALGVTGQDLESANSFDVDRIYLTADYTVSDRYSWQTIVEGQNNGGNLSLALKRAFLKIKTPFHLNGTALRFGQIGHVMTGHVEEVWGYRIVSKVPLDRYLGVSTTWVGVGMEAQLLHGYFDFDVSIANDKAYNVPQGAATYRDKYKSFMGRVSIVPMPNDELLKRFRVSLFSQYGSKDAPAGFAPEGVLNNTRWFGVFPHYRAEHWAAGFEFYRKYDRTSAPPPPLGYTEIALQYAGGFIEGDVAPRDRAFFRVDWFDPNRVKDDDEYLTLLGGVSHLYLKGLRTVLDLECTRFRKPSGVSLKSDVTISARAELNL